MPRSANKFLTLRLESLIDDIFSLFRAIDLKILNVLVGGHQDVF